MTIITDAVEQRKNWILPENQEQYFSSLFEETKKNMRAQWCYGQGRRFIDPGHKMARYGNNISYDYKGKKKPLKNLTPSLTKLVDAVNLELGTSFNTVVVNYYKDGNSTLYPHYDSKYIPQLGENPVIAMVSFGAARTMRFMKQINKNDFVDMKISSGELTIMHPECDAKWLHSIIKEEIDASRLSVTFRKHMF